MPYLFENKVTPSFINRLVTLSDRDDRDPNCAMFIMNNESGLLSDAVNSLGCTGLNQFCPDVSGGLYKTIGGIPYLLSDIAKMTPEAQLDLVFQYWKDIEKQYGKFASCDDLYLATFYPVAIDKNDDYVLGMERSNAYVQQVAKSNPSFDLNKDLKITKGEFKKWMDTEVYKKVPTAFYDTFFKKKTLCSYIKEKSSFGEASLLLC